MAGLTCHVTEDKPDGIQACQSMHTQAMINQALAQYNGPDRQAHARTAGAASSSMNHGGYEVSGNGLSLSEILALPLVLLYKLCLQLLLHAAVMSELEQRGMRTGYTHAERSEG